MKKPQTIESKVFIQYVIVLILLSLSIYTIFSVIYYHTYKKQVSAYLQDVETLTWNNIEGILHEATQLSIRILSDSNVQSGLTSLQEQYEKGISSNNSRLIKEIDNILRTQALTSENVSAIRIISNSGKMITYKTDNSNIIDDIPKEITLANNGRAHWFVSYDKKRIYLTRAILSLSNMKPLGYLVLVYSNRTISKKLAELNTPYEGNVYLINCDGEIFSSINEKVIGQKVLIHKDSNVGETFSEQIKDPISGINSYYYINDLADTEWKMIITMKSADIWKDMRIVMIIISILLLSLAAISVVIIKSIVRKAFLPAKQLQNCMRQFGNGDLNSRMTKIGTDEIGQISEGYNQMASKIQNLLEQVYSLEIATKSAEIDFLKMQINPHFLYNTLDTISWLGFKEHNEDVSNLAVSLAKLLRYSISSEDFVLIKREIECIQEYLEIQEYRFKDRFQMEIQVDERVKNLYMPKFLLQPLVENSFNHGLEGMIEKGHFLLSIQVEGKNVRFIIKDDGNGMSKQRYEEIMFQFQNADQKNTIGLINVYRRLQLLYGTEADFLIRSKEHEGTEISFRIPVLLSSDNKERVSQTKSYS